MNKAQSLANIQLTEKEKRLVQIIAAVQHKNNVEHDFKFSFSGKRDNVVIRQVDKKAFDICEESKSFDEDLLGVATEVIDSALNDLGNLIGLTIYKPKAAHIIGIDAAKNADGVIEICINDPNFPTAPMTNREHAINSLKNILLFKYPCYFQHRYYEYNIVLEKYEATRFRPEHQVALIRAQYKISNQLFTSHDWIRVRELEQERFRNAMEASGDPDLREQWDRAYGLTRVVR